MLNLMIGLSISVYIHKTIQNQSVYFLQNLIKVILMLCLDPEINLQPEVSAAIKE